MTLTEEPEVMSFEENLRLRSSNTTHLDFQLGDVAFKSGESPSVAILGESYKLTDGAFRQIAEEMGIPVPLCSSNSRRSSLLHS